MLQDGLHAEPHPADELLAHSAILLGQSEMQDLVDVARQSEAHRVKHGFTP